MNIHDSTRRRFVRNSLATSMSFSFAGLIRAHGGGGGQTTTYDPENTTHATTYNTTDSGTTATWDPEYGTTCTSTWDPESGTHETTAEGNTTTVDQEATTVETTHDPLVSLQKQIPDEGDGPIFHSSVIHGPNVYLRIVNLVSDFGLLEIKAGPNRSFLAHPTWEVTLSQSVKADEEQADWVPSDCASCQVHVKVELILAPDDQFPLDIPDGLMESLLDSIYRSAAPAIAANSDLLAERTAPGISTAFFEGPALTVGYNVHAAYGIDHGVPNQVGPLVAVGNRLGRVATSSHGYWLTLDSQLSPTPPSRSVNFEWRTKLRRSGFINVEEHVRAAILKRLNEGLIQDIQEKNPDFDVTVQCHIPALPTGEAIISQLVVASDLPPNSAGTDCPLMYPGECEQGSGLTPLNENPPDDDHWNQEDPEEVVCPPPPPPPPYS